MSATSAQREDQPVDTPEERRPLTTLRIDFRANAWRSELRILTFLVAAVAGMLWWRWTRSAEIARSYSEFWGLDPEQLPHGYWFGWEQVLLAAELVRLGIRKLRRNPHLTIGTTHIESSFTQSQTRKIERNRVTEVRIDPATQQIRFEIPDGLVLIVDGEMLEPGIWGNTAEAIARKCAGVLEVPLINRVPDSWWRRTFRSAAATNHG